ncbi:MAG: hypothetical protein IKC95_01090 [Oscillospiraceae bacterium]|nr:hypothetical protein [Oscillospiraceae bacterium]
MKKFGIVAIAFLLGVSLTACGGNNNDGTDNSSSTTPSSTVSILPETNPTTGTNIPDPDVDSNMPTYTDGTTGTDTTENSTKGNRSRRSY